MARWENFIHHIAREEEKILIDTNLMLAQAGSSALRPNEMLILRPTFYVLAADETKYTFISADQEIISQYVLDYDITEPPYIASSSTYRCASTLAVKVAITETVQSTNVPTSW